MPGAYRCTMCHRPMLDPYLKVGRMVLGPKCAKSAGLSIEKTRQAVSVHRQRKLTHNPTQQDLFDEEIATPNARDMGPAGQGQMSGIHDGALTAGDPWSQRTAAASADTRVGPMAANP